MFVCFLGLSCSYLIFCYPRKILILLSMECIFLSSFLIYCFSLFFSGVSLVLPCFLMMLFFVLDSVMGVTLLVSLGRSQSPHFSLFI